MSSVTNMAVSKPVWTVTVVFGPYDSFSSDKEQAYAE